MMVKAGALLCLILLIGAWIDGSNAQDSVVNQTIAEFSANIISTFSEDGNGSFLNATGFGSWYSSLFPEGWKDSDCSSPEVLFQLADYDGDGLLDSDSIAIAGLEMLQMVMSGCMDPPETDNSDDDLLLHLKIGFIFVIFIITLIGSLLPWILTKLHHAALMMEFGCCFAAGVVFGAGFSHILPDAQEGFANYFELAGPGALLSPDHMDYPFAELIAGAVLWLLIYIDYRLVHRGIDGSGHHHHGHMVIDVEKPFKTSPSVESPSSTPIVGTPQGESEDQPSRGTKTQIGQAYLLFIALSIHSIFDGLSVGVEEQRSGFYALLIAVVSHKMLDGFSLGIPVYYARFGWMQTLLMLGFCALMTPLGIGIGIAATSGYNGAAGQLSKAIILSMSLGSFIFISLVEMLPGGFASSRFTELKMLCVVVGWGVMALIALWV